jgi:hypothetical protein
LVELPIASTPTHVHPLWVELHNTSTGRVLDSAGCRDLPEAGAAAQRFIAEARRLSDAGPP